MHEFAIKLLGYDVTGIVAFIAGALISALISYILSSKREKKFYKMRIQNDTCETLFTLIKSFMDVSSKVLFFTISLDIQFYNGLFKKADLGGVDIIKDNSIKSFDDKCKVWHDDYENFANAFLSIQNFLENRQIVLINFQHFHEELSNCFGSILDLRKRLIVNIQKIKQVFFESKSVDEGLIIDFQNNFSQFQDVIFDINSYVLDMQTGLQNEFYSKIFGVKLPARQPKDPKYKVLLPQKNKAKFLS